MGKLTMGVFPGLVGSLSLDFSVKLAEAAVKKGHTVDYWVSRMRQCSPRRGRDHSRIIQLSTKPSKNSSKPAIQGMRM